MNKLNLLFLLLFLSGCNKEYINWQLGNLEDAIRAGINMRVFILYYATIKHKYLNIKHECEDQASNLG